MAWKTSAKIKSPQRTGRHLWVGFKPNGIGETKPNHYKEIVKTVWENRDNLPYAWRILQQGRVRRLRARCRGVPRLDPRRACTCARRASTCCGSTRWARSTRSVWPTSRRCGALTGRELRDLGRLAHPMVRRRGEPGLHSGVSWDEALDLVADRIRATAPDRLAVYLTARGITNETYYVAQKVARFLGTNNIDNAARVCHAPSTTTLKQTIGVAATTCSYTDVIESDLIVLFGANVANAPAGLHEVPLPGTQARREGRGGEPVARARARPLLGAEQRRERDVRHEDDRRVLRGAHRRRRRVPQRRAQGAARRGRRRPRLRARAHRGVRRAVDELDAGIVRRSRTAVGRDAGRHGALRAHVRARRTRRCWSGRWASPSTSAAPTTSPRSSTSALARGNVGRPGAGLMPIRGHSGVQGGAEMGAYATAFPGASTSTPPSAAALAEQYGFPVGDQPRDHRRGDGRGRRARRARRPLLVAAATSSTCCPIPPRSRRRWRGCRCACTRTSSCPARCWSTPARWSCCLPAATRYEQRDGGTETTTERRIAFSPEIDGAAAGRGAQRVGDLRRPGRVASIPTARHLVRVRRPVRRSATRSPASSPPTRASSGCARRATRSSGAGRGSARAACSRRPTARPTSWSVAPSEPDVPAGQLRAQHPPGQAVQHDGARRHATRSPAPCATRCSWRRPTSPRSALRDGDRVVVRSADGEMPARLHASDLRPGNVQVFFPEGNVLLRGSRRDPASGVPDYNAVVTVEPAPGEPRARRPARALRRRRAAQRGALATLGPAERRGPHRPARPVPASTSSPTPPSSRCSPPPASGC